MLCFFIQASYHRTGFFIIIIILILNTLPSGQVLYIIRRSGQHLLYRWSGQALLAQLKLQRMVVFIGSHQENLSKLLRKMVAWKMCQGGMRPCYLQSESAEIVHCVIILCQNYLNQHSTSLPLLEDGALEQFGMQKQKNIIHDHTLAQ